MEKEKKKTRHIYLKAVRLGRRPLTLIIKKNNFMNINGGFFSDAESDALMEMQRLAGCKVRRCAYPTTKNLTYYISEHGHLFSVQRIQGKLLTRGPKQPGSKYSHGKRKGGGMTLRLSNGKHGAGGESWIAAELLVYCTFILGRWEPDLQIDFKNGCATDLRPDNLMEHCEKIPPEWTEQLTEYVDIYRQNFDRVAESVKWWVGISKEDAKDVAQATFVWLCTSGYKGCVNAALWTFWAKRRGIDFYYKHKQHYDTTDCDTILEQRGRQDQAVEIDLFHIQNGKMRSRYLTLWAQGYTPTEIAEMTGSTTGNVGSSVTRTIQFLRKYFRHEKEMLRI